MTPRLVELLQDTAGLLDQLPALGKARAILCQVSMGGEPAVQADRFNFLNQQEGFHAPWPNLTLAERQKFGRTDARALQSKQNSRLLKFP